MSKSSRFWVDLISDGIWESFEQLTGEQMEGVWCCSEISTQSHRSLDLWPVLHSFHTSAGCCASVQTPERASDHEPPPPTPAIHSEIHCNQLQLLRKNVSLITVTYEQMNNYKEGYIWIPHKHTHTDLTDFSHNLQVLKWWMCFKLNYCNLNWRDEGFCQSDSNQCWSVTVRWTLSDLHASKWFVENIRNLEKSLKVIKCNQLHYFNKVIYEICTILITFKIG